MIKKSLREALLNIRKTLDETTIEKAQKHVLSAIKADKRYQASKVVGLYHAIFNEIDINSLRNDPLKRFALPVVVSDEIRYYEVKSDTKFRTNTMGILEPLDTEDITALLDYILVPAIGLSDTFYRIGYGKGYFDKFFSKNKAVFKVGIAYKYANINFEPSAYDIPMNQSFFG